MKDEIISWIEISAEARIFLWFLAFQTSDMAKKNPIVAEFEIKSMIRFIAITFPKSTPYAQRQKRLIVLTTVSSSKHILV